jgi:hypothetical protein
MNFQKLLYTVTGKKIPDNYSTNYKLRSNWFNYFTAQLNQYLLSNGITWRENTTKDNLGDKFDVQVKKLSRYALVHGSAFGFWNLDHLEPYSFLEFAPLYDEDNGALMAGVRFWRLNPSKPLRATLFEPDGYTDYEWNTNTDGRESGIVKEEKRAYIQIAVTTEAEGTIQGLDVARFLNRGFPILKDALDETDVMGGERGALSCQYLVGDFLHSKTIVGISIEETTDLPRQRKRPRFPAASSSKSG